jgi:DNA mismatch endonuclease (patch repair protein)
MRDVHYTACMADMFDRATRSRIMRTVRTRKTEPEELVAGALRQLKLRFRRHDPRLPGTPDFSFPDARLAVFVDGDFWHGRAWFQRGEAPATNREFWIRKFEVNRRHDRIVNRSLRRRGWSVLRLWASAVRHNPRRAAERVNKRLAKLHPVPRDSPSVSLSSRHGRTMTRGTGKHPAMKLFRSR